jgi:hypothetical protein
VERLIEPDQGEIGIYPGLSGRAGHLQDALSLDDHLSFHLRLSCVGGQATAQEGWDWADRSCWSS